MDKEKSKTDYQGKKTIKTYISSVFFVTTIILLIPFFTIKFLFNIISLDTSMTEILIKVHQNSILISIYREKGKKTYS